MVRSIFAQASETEFYISACVQHEVLLALAKASYHFVDRDIERCKKLCFVFKEFMARCLLVWLAARQGDCLLESYSSDCTSSLVYETTEATHGQVHVRRRGKSLREWLVQRCFVVDVDGNIMT